VIELLTAVWRGKVMVSSNLARDNAVITGLCASVGFISTKISHNVFSRQWHITPRGLHWLEGQDNGR
jgi:hypothetical protein